MTKLFSLILVFILVSCATGTSRYDLETVDVSDTDSSGLEISEKDNRGYGPNIEIETDEKSKTKVREPIIGLIHFSTLYHSQALIEELKKIESKKIRISLVSGYGFGGIIAALYAKERSVSYVEWKLFSLTKRLGEHDVYSDDWKEVLSKFLREEFKSQKVNQLAIQLIVPTVKNGIIIYDNQAMVADVLISSLSIESEKHYIRQPLSFESDLKKDFSLDFIYKTSYIPVTPTITHLSSLQYGFYTSYLGKLLSKPEQYGLLKAPVKQEIDEIGLQSDLINLYDKLIDERTQKFEKELEAWREESNPTFNTP